MNSGVNQFRYKYNKIFSVPVSENSVALMKEIRDLERRIMFMNQKTQYFQDIIPSEYSIDSTHCQSKSEQDCFIDIDKAIPISVWEGKVNRLV